MNAQRRLWLLALVVLAAISARADEPPADGGAKAETRPVGVMARVESVGSAEAPEAPNSGEAEGRPEKTPATLAMSAGSGQATVPTSAGTTTGPDAGPVVMLRCRGADGVFTFDAGSDDFVAWAFSPGPIDLTVPYGLHYKFGVVPPLGEVCRVFREPFPPGVVPPGGGSGG